MVVFMFLGKRVKMMYKKFLVPLGLSLLLLSGCMNTDKVEITYETSGNTTQEEVSTEAKEFKWGTEDFNKMQNILSSCTYIAFTQETRVQNNEGFYNYNTYNVSVNLADKTANIVKTSGDNIHDGFTQANYKYEQGKFYKEEYGVWQECELEDSVFETNIKFSENAYDYLSVLIHLSDLNAELNSKLEDNNCCVISLNNDEESTSFTTYGIDMNTNLPIYCLEEYNNISTSVIIETLD